MNKSIYEEALNKFRKIIENYIIDKELELKYLKLIQKQDKLLELYKHLSYIRLMLFCETDPVVGQCLMDKDDEILKQIKELEK